MKMSSKGRYISVMGNAIALGMMGTIAEVTFSSVIALVLMSLIIPSDVTLASPGLIDGRAQINLVEEDLEKIGVGMDPFREKRGVPDKDMDVMGLDLEMDGGMEINNSDATVPTLIEQKYGPWESGPMKTISDSLFSLIILIYVAVIFIFMFFAFCWKEPEPPPPDPAHKNIPMITSMLDEMEKQIEENKKEEEERISIEKESSIGKECTEMTELKTGIEISRYDSSTSINKSKLAVKTPKELENNSATINRKDAETIVVNVITEKTKSSASVNFKEEQV